MIGNEGLSVEAGNNVVESPSLQKVRCKVYFKVYVAEVVVFLSIEK